MNLITEAAPALVRRNAGKRALPAWRRVLQALRSQVAPEPPSPGRDAETTETFEALNAEIRARGAAVTDTEAAGRVAMLAFDLNDLGARLMAHSGLPEAAVRRILDDAFYAARLEAQYEADGRLYPQGFPAGRHAAPAAITPAGAR